MQTQAIYKSPVGEKALMELYDKALGMWPVPAGSMYIDTDYGKAFILACGSQTAPPLVLLHGSGGNTLTWMGDSAAYSCYFRVYLADIPGEAGKSAPNRPACR